MKARFCEAELSVAVARVLSGEKISAVLNTTNVSRSSIKRRLNDIKHSKPRKLTRPGSKPLLPAACEEDLVTWIAAMQRAKLPVHSWEVLATASEQRCAIHGATRSVKDLTLGWYARFMGRHPELALRTSEPLSRARQGGDSGVYRQLFHAISKDVIELKLDGTRIHNMDETSFVSKHQTKPAVAVRGSSCVWTKLAETSFHLSVVAAVSAVGHAIPPLFVVPGKRVCRTSLDGCSIEHAGIVTAAKGFVNGKIFEMWIDHFAECVPASVPRPLLLVCDGCPSHVGAAVAARCKQRGIVLKLLPPNATRLIQPLDVAVFRGYKRAVSTRLRKVLRASASQTISRREALAVASDAYITNIVENPSAAINGFRTCGLFPLSFPAMMERCNKSITGGVMQEHLGAAEWLRVRDEARATVLALPPPPVRKQGSRKTIDATTIVRKSDMLQSPQRVKKKRTRSEEK